MTLFMREYKWQIIMWVIVLEGLLNNFMTFKSALYIIPLLIENYEYLPGILSEYTK